MSTAVQIDVLFDFICPWCLIGKRQLERALQQLAIEAPDTQVSVTWRGVQLLPNLPWQGERFAEFYLRRLGSAQAVQRRQAQVREAAAAVGLEIDFSRIARMPNTADAHRLLERANALDDRERANALLERLFSVYFERGEDLSDRDTLLRIARATGYDEGLLGGDLLGTGHPYRGSHRAGDGVPAFRIDGEAAVVGAQPAEVLLQVLRKALHAQQPL